MPSPSTTFNLFCSFQHPTTPEVPTQTSRASPRRCSAKPPFPLGLVRPPSVKIPPFEFPPRNPTLPSVPPELKLSPPSDDLKVVITDSHQSSWLSPSTASSLPAPSQTHQPQAPSSQSFNRDWVLFESSSSQLQPPPPNRSKSQPNNFGLSHTNRVPATGLTPLSQKESSLRHRDALKQLRNAANSALKFYSNSAPSSAAAVNQVHHCSPPAQRPSVPLFNQPSQMELDVSLPDDVFGGPLSTFSSPAEQIFDTFSIAPQDLYMGMAAPNSAATTMLTTPTDSFEPSPGYSDWDNSPLIVGDNEAGNWPTLFPEVAAPAEVEQSPVIEPEEVPQKPTSRKASATILASTRKSSSSGVSASRRKTKPLAPIHVDDAADEKSMKRARNTLAARKSRARRQNHMDELEGLVREMEARAEKAEQERDHYKHLWESTQ